MANAVFITSESSAYDDQPEIRYHFPKTYFRQATQSVGDWIVYYEPRRNAGINSAGGRQSYFAMARVARIEADTRVEDHFYAYLEGYLEFDQAVPFRDGTHYYESGLIKADGSTNKGAFGRAIRSVPAQEFSAIVAAGFTRRVGDWETASGVAEPVVEYVVRPVVEQIVTRKFRDEAFRRHVRTAYNETCAITGLRLINGGGRPEVQAAHIRPVEHDGPDSVRNGLALTSTVHWLFDRGLISIDESYKLMISPAGVPNELDRLIPKNREISLPGQPELRPHQTYLKWHRDFRFKQA